jgi:hypothetical protein
VISANHQWNLTGFEGFLNQVGFLRARLRNLFQILGVRRAFLLLFGDSNGYVTRIFDVMADLFQSRFETGYADRRWSHVDAPARLTQVERNADYANFARHQSQYLLRRVRDDF